MGCGASKDDSATVLRGASLRSFSAVGATEHNLARKDRRRGSKVGDQTKTITAAKIQDDRPLPQLDEKGRLLPQEIEQRTRHSKCNKKLVVGTKDFPIEIEYAYWTQRGYYPDDPFKNNQDDMAACSPFAGEQTGAMFAVFDGHGKNGHDCSAFAKKNLPRLAEKYIRQARVKKYENKLIEEGKLKGTKLFDPSSWPYLSPDEYKACCQRAFLDCNKEMQESTAVEAELSGTTAVSASFHGNMISVCNVGDSRVIVGHRVRNEDESQEGKEPEEYLLAIPLSRDQTPYRKDERERVKGSGATVMSIDQIEGHEPIHENFGDLVLGDDVDYHGDPPRVWVEGKNYPGTAFTRSLGDGLAESIGVTAEPEIICRNLTVNDEILVIASDGIFEFLTNKEVVDMIESCGDAFKACECLVQAAYNQWLTYERRTDDITIMICFLKCSFVPENDVEGTTEDLVGVVKSAYGTKPARRPRGAKDTLCRPAAASISLPSGTVLDLDISDEDNNTKHDV